MSQPDAHVCAPSPAPDSASRLKWLAWTLRLLVALPLAAVAAAAAAYVIYDQVQAPRSLEAAGPIALGHMTSETPPEWVLPPAAVPGNAADVYTWALNEYNRRRVPFVQKRKLNPIAQEPPIDPLELACLVAGAARRDCDFYEGVPGAPRFVFVIQPSGKPFPMLPAVDPFALRPYIAPLRALAQAALNRGKELEHAGKLDEARTIYESVTRLGWHVRQKPGCLMDIELGIEIERNGLHYLEKLHAIEGNLWKRRLCWRYGDSVSELLRAVRRKYTQLDNVEAARVVLQRDVDRVWRIEAAAALTGAPYYHHLGILEAWMVRRSLAQARHDRDPWVRKAADQLAAMTEKDFVNPQSEIEPSD